MNTAKAVLRLGMQTGTAVTAWRRLADARRDGDRLELADAIAHAVVLVTGTALLVRQLRRERSGRE